MEYTVCAKLRCVSSCDFVEDSSLLVLYFCPINH